MTPSHDLRRALLAVSLLGGTALLSACGHSDTQTTERTTTTTVAPPQGAAVLAPAPGSTSTTTRTVTQTP